MEKIRLKTNDTHNSSIIEYKKYKWYILNEDMPKKPFTEWTKKELINTLLKSFYKTPKNQTL